MKNHLKTQHDKNEWSVVDMHTVFNFSFSFSPFLYTKSLPCHLIPPQVFILSSEMLRQLLCCFKFPVHLVSSQKHSVQLTSMKWAAYIKISNKTMVVNCSSSSTRTLEVVCIFTIFVPKKHTCISIGSEVCHMPPCDLLYGSHNLQKISTSSVCINKWY